MHMVFNAIWFIHLKERTLCQNQFSKHKHKILYLVQKTAHSVHADPPSCPTWLVLLILAHVVSALIEQWLFYLSRLLGGQVPLTPLLQADPIFLRSQAIARFHVGHRAICELSKKPQVMWTVYRIVMYVVNTSRRLFLLFKLFIFFLYHYSIVDTNIMLFTDALRIFLCFSSEKTDSTSINLKATLFPKEERFPPMDGNGGPWSVNFVDVG